MNISAVFSGWQQLSSSAKLAITGGLCVTAGAVTLIGYKVLCRSTSGEPPGPSLAPSPHISVPIPTPPNPNHSDPTPPSTHDFGDLLDGKHFAKEELTQSLTPEDMKEFLVNGYESVEALIAQADAGDRNAQSDIYFMFIGRSDNGYSDQQRVERWLELTTKYQNESSCWLMLRAMQPGTDLQPLQTALLDVYPTRLQQLADQQNAHGTLQLAAYHALQGQPEKGRALIEGLNEETLSAELRGQLGVISYYCEDYEKAYTLLKSVLESDVSCYVAKHCYNTICELIMASPEKIDKSADEYYELAKTIVQMYTRHSDLRGSNGIYPGFLDVLDLIRKKDENHQGASVADYNYFSLNKRGAAIFASEDI